MKTTPTPLFSKFLAESVKNLFSSESNTYIGIGRSLAFGSGSSNVEEAFFSTNKINELYSNLVGIKKVAASDMQIVLARRDWAANLVYDQYDDAVELFSYDKYTDVGTCNANSNTVLTGTANIFASNVVVGNGTSFLLYVWPGDQISVNSAVKTVVSVTNNQHLLVNSNFANSNTGSQVILLANARTVVANSANLSSEFVAGNTIIIGSDTRQVVSVLSSKVLALNSALTYSNSNVSVQRLDNTFPQFANNFYVRNNRDQVFKCLDNNERANSTIEPTIDIDGQLPENAFILTADGYKWKYMYTIPTGLKQKFFTDIWMPVANDAAVVQASEDGRIDSIAVLWGGSGYLSGGNSNTAAIISITNTDGANSNLVARVVSGSVVAVNILDGGNNYTRGTVVVTDSTRLGNTVLSGTVNVSGTIVTGNASNSTHFTGNVYAKDLITVGGQTRNVVSVINNTSLTVNTGFAGTLNTAVASIQRSTAVFDIQFPPSGGHGSNPAKELGARTLMLSLELDGDENSTIPVSDGLNTFDFNQVSIIQNPLVANGAFTANAVNYRVSERVLVSDPGITNFIDDETVFVGQTLGAAKMVANVAHWDSQDNYLYINNITGSYSASELINGVTSGAVTTVLEIEGSQIKKYSGDLLYIGNRKNTTRNQSQIEQIKVVFTF